MDCPYKDTLTTKVAKYITDALNSYLERYNKLYPAEKKWDKAVVGYRDYDAFDVPLSDFPLIKVYRVADSFRKGSKKSATILRISYCLAYPQLEELSSLMQWAAKVINEVLLDVENELNLEIVPEGGNRADYNTFMGQNGKPGNALS